jgi:glycosyltransferase involved in cell wall biosynthesis
MKVLHINAGEEDGGGKTYILSLLSQFNKDEITLAVFDDGPVAAEAREEGIHVHVFAQNSRYDLSILKRIVAFINDEQFDIIHTHGPRANFYASIIKDKIKAKWALTVHSDPTLDFMKSGIKGWMFTKLGIRALRKADLVFSITDAFKKKLLHLGVPEENIRVVYSGIMYDEHEAIPIERKEIGVSQGDFVIAHVARLHPVKAHEVLFDAISKVKQQDVRVLLVGDGAIRTELEEKVRELNIENKIIFLGFRTDVKHILAASDISILTSYSEGSPLVLLEAANQHIPCITTDVGNVRTLIPNEQYGWVVPVKDSDALAEAIEEAYTINKQEKLREIGDRLYGRASERFSLANLYKETIKYYQEMMK